MQTLYCLGFSAHFFYFLPIKTETTSRQFYFYSTCVVFYSGPIPQQLASVIFLVRKTHILSHIFQKISRYERTLIMWKYINNSDTGYIYAERERKSQTKHNKFIRERSFVIGLGCFCPARNPIGARGRKRTTRAPSGRKNK